jgi:DsbC/DsbD-like thiol-disulfide interchange protein
LLLCVFCVNIPSVNRDWFSKGTARWLAMLGVALSVLAGSGCAHNRTSDSATPSVPEPSRVEPVKAAMAFDRASVQPGDSVQVVVRVRIAGGHHIYSARATQGLFTPTCIRVDLPNQLEWLGEWILPQPAKAKGGESVYTDSVDFRRRARVRLNTSAGTLSIKGELLCQACDEELCRPPGKIPLSTSVVVLSK